MLDTAANDVAAEPLACRGDRPAGAAFRAWQAGQIRYMSQTKTGPPSFVLFANRPQAVQESYLRYLANGLRDSFELQGVPLRLVLRRSAQPLRELNGSRRAAV